MPSYLRASVLALLLCTACDAGKPQTGSPGLEPPHGVDGAAGVAPAAGQGAGGMGMTAGSAGTGTPSSGGAAGAAGAGGALATGGGGASGNAGMGAILDPGASDGGLADGGAQSFSELHATELMKDCTETVQCSVQRDEPLEADPIASCLEDSAAALDADPSRQAAFLATVARCSALVVCDYVNCATTPP